MPGIDNDNDSKLRCVERDTTESNAKTSIGYTLPFDSHVRIVIYILLGQSIETLFNRDESAGYHQVLWDAADMPTGVYFYRIEAAGFTAARKMLLAK